MSDKTVWYRVVGIGGVSGIASRDAQEARHSFWLEANAAHGGETQGFYETIRDFNAQFIEAPTQEAAEAACYVSEH